MAVYRLILLGMVSPALIPLIYSNYVHVVSSSPFLSVIQGDFSAYDTAYIHVHVHICVHLCPMSHRLIKTRAVLSFESPAA